MGILDIFTKQFVDVIDWIEPDESILAYQYPMTDREIQNGAKLTVRESQYALFVNEGKIADLFGPGLYTLNTQTLPIYTTLNNIDKLFASPFKSDVYFFSSRLKLDQKWGTSTPITVRDKELGPIRIRAHGNYAYHITEPRTFFTKISGTKPTYTTDDLEGQLRTNVLTAIASFLGSAEVNFIDMAANQSKFSEALAKAAAPEFQKYGLALESLQVQSLSLPDELQTRFDEKSSMNILGDLKSYAQFQTAKSIATAAEQGDSVAGVGVNMGAGFAMGQMMKDSLEAGKDSKTESPIAVLEQLHELFKKGILTQAEFDAKKSELMKKIS